MSGRKTKNPFANFSINCVSQLHSLLIQTVPVRFLDLIKPFTPLLPEVAAPETKVPFNQKLMWTGVCLFPRGGYALLLTDNLDLKS